MKTLILAAIRCSLMFTAVTASLFSIRPAQANYIVRLQRVGFDTVVATGSGALDLTGLTQGDGAFSGALIAPDAGNILTGPTNSHTVDDIYQGPFTGPSNLEGEVTRSRTAGPGTL